MNQAAAGMTGGATKNFIVLKEPRGMIKLVQIFMGILAIATTVSYESSFEVKFVNCIKSTKPDERDRVYPFKWSYPFRVADDNKFDETPCDSSKNDRDSLIWGDYAASSQFFVAVGVISILYATGVLAVYIFFDAAYRANPRIAQYDFLISCALTGFWLLSTAAWASGVSDLKFYTDPMRVLKDIDYCYNNVTKQVDTNKCKLDDDDAPDYASLHVSLIAGFTCFAVWAGGLWFLFKETSYAALVLPSMQNPWDSVPTNANSAGMGMGMGMGMPGSMPPGSTVPNPFGAAAGGPGGPPMNPQFDGRYAAPGAAPPNPNAFMNAPTGYGAQPPMGGYVPPGQAMYGAAGQPGAPGAGMGRM